MEAFLLNLAFRVLRLVFGWLFKLIRPVVGSIVAALWPIIRALLIVTALIAAILVLSQVLARRARIRRE